MMTEIKPILYLFLTFFIFFISCHEKGSNQLNNKAFKEELKSRELKRVSEAEISNAAYQKGIRITNIAEEMLMSIIQDSSIQEKSLANVIERYDHTHQTIKDSLAEAYNSTISRVSLKTANDTNEPNDLEKILLDAYLYNVENNLPLEDNIQQIDGSSFLYTRPILISNTACLRCHGEIGKDISEENYQVLKKYNSQNKAFGYKLHELRGLWSVKLSKKDLIKEL